MAYKSKAMQEWAGENQPAPVNNSVKKYKSAAMQNYDAEMAKIAQQEEKARQQALLEQQEAEAPRKATLRDLTLGSVTQGYKATKYGDVHYNEIMTGKEKAKAQRLKEQLDSDRYNFEAQSGAGKAVSGAAHLIGQLAYQTTNAKTLGMAGAAAGLAAGVGAAVPLPEEAVTIPVALGKGIAAGSAVTMHQVEAANAYDEMVAAGVSDKDAKIVANIIGLGVGALEAVQADELLKSVKLLKGVKGEASQKAAVKLAEALTKKQAAKAVGKVAGATAWQTAQETAQEGVNILGQNYARNKDNAETISKEEAVQRLKDTAVQSALSFGLLEGVGAVGGAVMSRNNVKGHSNEAESANNEAENTEKGADNADTLDNDASRASGDKTEKTDISPEKMRKNPEKEQEENENLFLSAENEALSAQDEAASQPEIAAEMEAASEAATLSKKQINAENGQVSPASKRYGKEGRKTVKTIADATPQKLMEAEQMYRAGQLEQQKPEFKSLTKNESTAMYMAGVADGKASRTAYSKKQFSPNVKAGLVVETAQHIHEKDRQVYNKIGMALGVRISFADAKEMKGVNAKYDTKTNEIVISKETEFGTKAALAHEIVHELRIASPKEYEALAKAVMEYAQRIGVADKDVEAHARMYDADKGKIKYYDMLEETVADFVAKYADSDAFAQMLTKEPALRDKVVQIIRDIIRKLQKLVVDKDTRKLINEWEGVLKKLDTAVKATEGKVQAEADRIYKNATESNKVTAEDAQRLSRQFAEDDGTDFVLDESTGAVYIRESKKSYDESVENGKLELIRQLYLKNPNVTEVDADRYIQHLKDIRDYIAMYSSRLDYEPDRDFEYLKSNSDYGFTADSSSNCIRRKTFQDTLDAVLKVMKTNGITRTFTKDDYMMLRRMLVMNNYKAGCGVCYVDGARMYFGEMTDKLFKKHPELKEKYGYYDFMTQEGQVKLKKENPELLNEFIKINGSQNRPMPFEARTDYRNELYTRYTNADGSIKEAEVNKVNDHGGFRVQSFSDFELVNALDLMQVIFDAGSVGLKGQAYSKVISFFKLVNGTNLMTNISVFGKGKGVDENGNLVFDNVQGVPIGIARQIRDWNDKQFGTCLVGNTLEHVIAAMKTDYIDYIIPFHRSQIKTKDFGKLDIQGNDDFTVIQLEKIKDPKTGRWRNPRNAEERKLIPSVDDWWDYDATAEQNARNYLKLCHERGIKPKFIGSIGSKAKGTQKNVNLAYETDDITVLYSDTLPIREGYYKLLVDFRRYDNSGKAIRQQPVVPNFNVNVIKEMLDAYKYEGSPTDANYKNDAVQEIVDEFISKFGDKKPTEADILGYKGEYNELTSIRNYNEDAPEDVERLYGDERYSKKVDAEYMDAYWDGDDDRMQELVDEAAYRAGYKYKAYHHTENGFTVFDLDKARKNMDIQGFYFFADAEEGNEYGSVTYDTYLKMENPYIVDSREKQNAIPFDMSKDNAGVTAKEWLQEQGYDSVIRKAEYFGAGADEYIVFDSAQIKSAEAMTFEDDEYGEGDIIPLSERFNEDNKDIRWSKSNIKEHNEIIHEKRFADLGKREKELYKAGKNGDVKKAYFLAKEIVTTSTINKLKKFGEDANIIIVSKKYGTNVNSMAFAKRITSLTNQQIFRGVFQKDATSTKDMPIWDRMKLPIPKFDMENKADYNKIKGRKFILIDDNSTTGRTFTGLKFFIEKYGGEVVGYYAPTIGQDMAEKLTVTNATWKKITSLGIDNVKRFAEENGIKRVVSQKGLSEYEAEELLRQYKRKYNVGRGNENASQVGGRSIRGIGQAGTGRNGNKSSIKYKNLNYRDSRKSSPTIPDGMRERGFNESVRTKSDYDKVIQQEFIDFPEIYKQLANKVTKAKAQAIMDKGLAFAEAEFPKLLERMDATAIALGDLMAREYSNMGEYDKAVTVIRDMARQLTKAGQFSQAAVIALTKSNPMTALAYAKRDIAKLNTDGHKQFGKKWKDFEITAEEEEMFKNIKQGDADAIKAAYEVINKRIEKEYPTTIWQKFVEASRISMLLNPRTNVKNVVSNLLLWPVTRGSGMVSAGMQKAYRHFNKNYKQTQSVMPVKKDVRHMAEGVWENIKDTLETTNKYNEGIKANKRDIVVFKEGIGTRVLENIAPGTLHKLNQLMKTDDAGLMETLRHATYYFLEWGDNVFVKQNFISRLGSYLQANNITDLNQLSEEDLKGAIAVAYKEALRATFKDDTALSKWMASIKHTGNPYIDALMEMIMPFTKTPANIAMRGIDYSPIGLINTLSKFKKTGDLDELFDELGKNGLGTALILLGALLFSKGIVTGGEPENEKEAAFLKQQGWQPYAVKTPNGNYVTYDWAQPAAIPVIMGVTVMESLEEGRLGVVDAVKNAGVASFNQWIELSPLQSLKEVMGGYDSVGENLLNTAIEMPQRLIPSALGATARTADTTQRLTYSKGNVAQTQKDIAKSKVPGLSQTLPAAYDTWGREKKRDDSTFGAAVSQYINPSTYKKGNTTEVDAEIDRLYKAVGDTAVYPRKAAYSIERGGKTYTLSNSEYSEYQRIMGELSYDGVKALMEKPTYSSLTDLEKAEIIKDIYDNAFEKAKFTIMEGQGYEKTSEDIRTAKETKIKQVYMEATPENTAEYYIAYYILNNAESDKASNGKTIAGSKKKNGINRLVELGFTRSQAKRLYEAMH